MDMQDGGLLSSFSEWQFKNRRLMQAHLRLLAINFTGN